MMKRAYLKQFVALLGISLLCGAGCKGEDDSAITPKNRILPTADGGLSGKPGKGAMAGGFDDRATPQKQAGGVQPGAKIDPVGSKAP